MAKFPKVLTIGPNIKKFRQCYSLYGTCQKNSDFYKHTTNVELLGKVPKSKK